MTKRGENPNSWMVQQSAIVKAGGNKPYRPPPTSNVPGVSRHAPPTTRVIGTPYGAVTVPVAAPHAPPNLAVSGRIFQPQGPFATPVNANGGAVHGHAPSPTLAGHAHPTPHAPAPRAVIHVHGGPPAPAGHGGSAGASSGASTTRGAAKGAQPAAAKPGPTGPPPPDAISQMIAGALQQSRRLTDYYDTQTAANQAATVAGGQTLSAAAGGLSSTVPSLAYVQPGGDPLTAETANHYTDLVNAVGSANAKADAGVNQANIADSAAAMNNLFGLQRAALDQGSVTYGQQLKASEPSLRAAQAASDADTSMKVAEQQYLRDKLSLQGQQAVDSSKQNWTKISDARVNAATSADIARAKIDASGYNAQQKALNAKALAGQKLSAAQAKITNAWIDKFLYVKDPTTGGASLNGDVSYTDILDQLGARSGPGAAAQAALTYKADEIAKAGPNDFYAALTGHDLGKRQALKYLSMAGFSQKQVNQIKRYGYAGSGPHPAVTGALGTEVAGAIGSMKA